MAYDMYQEIILQHYRAPRNFGTLAGATRSGEESNPLCGDHIRFDLQLDAAGTLVEDVRFSGDGCAISVASASLLTQRVKGKPLAEVQGLTREDIFKLVGIPLSPVRVKCALTGFVALGRALHPEASSSAGADRAPSPERSGASPA
jgi:nitrogen fixation protein NifU and related proteins